VIFKIALITANGALFPHNEHCLRRIRRSRCETSSLTSTIPTSWSATWMVSNCWFAPPPCWPAKATSSTNHSPSTSCSATGRTLGGRLVRETFTFLHHRMCNVTLWNIFLKFSLLSIYLFVSYSRSTPRNIFESNRYLCSPCVPRPAAGLLRTVTFSLRHLHCIRHSIVRFHPGPDVTCNHRPVPGF